MRDAVRGLVQRASRGRVVWRGPTDRRRVALTFDDGPDDRTPRYLDALDRLGVPATFFVMGLYVEQRPGVVAAYLRGGHQVACHGWFHLRYTRLWPHVIVDHLRRTERAFGPLPHGRWVRPPHGALGPHDLATLIAAGYTVGMWSLDSRDWDGAPADVLAARCAPARVRPGEVILFHEGQDTTLDALPRIVGALRDDGYELVTMADLFAR